MPWTADSVERVVDLLENALSTTDLDSTRQLARRAGQAAVLDELRRRREHAYRTGREAKGRLYDHLIAAVDPVARPVPEERNLLEVLVEQTGDLPLVPAFLLVRRNLDALGPDAYRRAAYLVRVERPDLADAVLTFLVAWTRAARDTRWWHDGTLLWAELCRRRGDETWARWHAYRVERAGEGAPAHDRSLLAAFTALRSLRDGDFPTALEQFTAAAERAGDEGGGMPLYQYYRAVCLRRLGRPAEAVRALGTALSELDRPLHDDPLWIGRCHLLRGLVLEDLGDVEDAAPDYELAANSLAEAGDAEEASRARTYLAANQLKRHRPDLAVPSFRAIVRDAERFGTPGALAAARNNLASAYLDAERPEAAFVEFGAALVLRGEEPEPGTVISLFGMADALERQGRSETAAGFRGLAFLDGLRCGDVVSAMSSFIARVTSPDEVTDGFERAIHEAALRVEAAHDAQETLTLWIGWGRYLQTCDRPAEARVWYESCLATIDTRRWGGPLADVVRRNLAQLCARAADGTGRALDLALGSVERAETAIADRVLDDSRGEAAGVHAWAYDLAVSVLSEPGERCTGPEGRSGDEAAFDLHERARARALLARMASSPMPVPATADPHLVAEEAALLDTIRRLQGPSPERPLYQDRDAQLAQVAAARTALAAVHRSMAPAHPEYVRLRSGTPVELEALRRVLSACADTPTIVSFHCLENHLICFVVRPGGALSVRRTPVTRAELDRAARELRADFNGDPTAFPPTPPPRRDAPGSRSQRALAALGSRVLPFLDDVEPGALLCLVPHGPLHELPLHAVEVAPGRPLALEHPVVYSPSLSVLAHTLWRDPPATPIERALVVGVAGTADPHPEYFENDEDVLPGTWNVEALSGPGATRSRMLNGMTRVRPDVLHVCAHGVTDPVSPLRSGLLLGDGAQRPRRDDGGRLHGDDVVVSAADLARAGIGARLICLRACSAGVERRLHGGDEYAGFGRALLSTGAGTIVSPLWNVDQRSSREFLGLFYRSLARRAPMWKALWSAQLSMYEEGDTPAMRHPYHWAPFTLIGEWR